jgi:hypothetical protein
MLGKTSCLEGKIIITVICGKKGLLFKAQYTWFHLLLEGRLPWHFELQRFPFFLHKHHFEVQFFMHAQRTNPCPVPSVAFLTAELREIL